MKTMPKAAGERIRGDGPHKGRCFALDVAGEVLDRKTPPEEGKPCFERGDAVVHIHLGLGGEDVGELLPPVQRVAEIASHGLIYRRILTLSHFPRHPPCLSHDQINMGADRAASHQGQASHGGP
jgi:hypothetical protein